MEFKASSILLILEGLAQKHQVTLDFPGFGKLEEKLCAAGLNISQRYLYENMYRQATKAFNAGGSEETIRLSGSHVNEILQHLGYPSYKEFDKQIKLASTKLDPMLESCLGSWYSYVRFNSGEPIILQAPVEIYQSEENPAVAMMKLQGGRREFKGKIRLIKELGGVMNCSLDSDTEDKILHFVLKLGINYHPTYIKGVFSGVSSFGEPIAGKEVLIRQELPYSELKADRITVDEAKASDNPQLRAMGKFFEHYEGNNIKELSSNIISF